MTGYDPRATEEARIQAEIDAAWAEYEAQRSAANEEEWSR